MRLRALLLVLCAPCLLWFCVRSSAAYGQQAALSTPATPSYRSDPKFQAAMAQGAQLAEHRVFGFAADSYKKANKIAGGSCMECLRGLYGAQMSMGSFKDAAHTADAMENLATTPEARSAAECRHATALFDAAGEKPKPEKLREIHAFAQKALSNNPQNAAALFLDGQVMASLGQMNEAQAEFAKCAACVSPKDPARFRAQHFAEEPELATHKMAPPFEVVALDGSRFNLDAMGGRVVLIDFWATWCGPCVNEIPHLKRIAQQFAGQPLVIISVSWDNDEARWKEYVAKNGMTWTQYRDADHKLAYAFGVNAIPHYFTIDADGVLTSEMVGGGADVEGKLKKLLAKAREAQKETVASGTGSSLPGN